MKVKRTERSNTYCGPAALSLITGRTVDDCVAAVHSIYKNGFLSGGKRRPVRGVSRHEMICVLKQFGYTWTFLPVGYKGAIPYEFRDDVNGLMSKAGPTLVGFRRWQRRRGFDPKAVYLVEVTGHWLVMKGIKLFDNANPEGVFFGKYKRRRRRVRLVLKVARAVPSAPSA